MKIGDTITISHGGNTFTGEIVSIDDKHITTRPVFPSKSPMLKKIIAYYNGYHQIGDYFNRNLNINAYMNAVMMYSYRYKGHDTSHCVIRMYIKPNQWNGNKIMTYTMRHNGSIFGEF